MTTVATTPGVIARTGLALRDIKLAHSVFALPFAVLGAFLAAPRTPAGVPDWARFGVQLALVVVCMFFARTWAMLVNRVADARLDAANPRTARRAFAAGALTRADAGAMLGVSALGFLAACAGFGLFDANWWPLILGAPVLAWIGFYSFTKRFTWLCHAFLGGALAASPPAAALAVGGPGALTGPDGAGVWWLAGMVLFWVGGFDVIYALQDREHDRRVGLNSVPARFGWRGAAWVSRGAHLAALACLAAAWWSSPLLGPVFGAAVAAVAVVLAWEHAVLARRGAAGIPMAFFTLNGVVALTVGVAGVAATLA